ncbi:DUF3352 domain-containing protein, partial [Oscillatoriales cyanobacterium LEGE 11467]|nr:DUF3352 domain-containing protein [Zarconia navalis LEGE 11467]
MTVVPGGAVAQPLEESEPLPPIVPRIAEVLPANLPGALLVDTTETWSDLESFNPLPFEISGPGGIPFLPMETDFNTDIRPWVGKWAATVLLPARDPYGLDRSSIDASVLTLVSVNDTARMNAYLETVATLRGTPPIERDFQGTKIWEWEADESPELEFPPELSPESEAPGDLGMKGAIVQLKKALPSSVGEWFDRLAQ